MAIWRVKARCQLPTRITPEESKLPLSSAQTAGYQYLGICESISALQAMMTPWDNGPPLQVFLTDGRVELDNLVENVTQSFGLRPLN